MSSLYPNAAKDFISIKVLQSGRLEIFNAAGTIPENSEMLETLAKIDISNLPDGYYYVRVVSKDRAFINYFIKIN